MRVLAIDPGPTHSAWVRYDTDVRCVLDHDKEENDAVRSSMGMMATRLECVAIERIASYGMPVGAEVFETCVWVGRFLECADQCYSLPTELVFRRDVKLHLCGSVRAKDANVRQALIDLVGPRGTKKAPGPTYGIKADEWAALGVAVTWAATRSKGA
jgi:hypothetical protein